jgi:hypothetical protein
MNRHVFRTLAGLSVVGLLATGATVAQAQQVVQARVISATPIRETTGSDVSYNVTYEYQGRQYTTRTTSRPGATIPVQASAYGVTTTGATSMPVQPQPQIYPVEANNGQQYQQDPQYQEQYQQGQQGGGAPWESVVPEPGVVVSGQGAPVYAQPAPVYAPPVYVQPAYGYPYAQPYVYPPVGISLNLGYSRGWGGGYYGRGYGGYRGGYGYRGYGGYRGGWHR